MSLKEALTFEIACCDKELEDAVKKVKTLRKRLKYLNALLSESETDKPFNPHEEISNG